MKNFFRKKLKNGVVVIMEKRELPVVALSITNRFGGAYEASEIKGIAHFIEHLLFTGTESRTSEDISREIEKKGGVLNAYTAHEMTSFWFKLPSEHLFSGLDILIDMLNNPKFDEDKFEKEKKVILEEIKMYHDDPKMHVFDLIEKNMYEKPFGELIIGSKESVSGLKRDFVAEYFRDKYNPENYVVTIVGNADFEKVCSHIEKNFKPTGKKHEGLKIKIKNGKSVQERNDLDQAHYIFAIHAPLPEKNDFYALQVLDAYLANGMSSKLFIEIREKRGLAYAVKSSVAAEKNYSHYMIYVGTRKDAVKEVEKIILQEIKNVESMSEGDLKEAKERIIGLRKVSSEESSDVMNQLVQSEFCTKAEEYYEFEEKVRNVKLEDVKRLARIKEYSTAAIVPK